MPLISSKLFTRARLIAGMLVAVLLSSCSPSIASPKAPQEGGMPDVRAAYKLFQVDFSQRSLMTGQAIMTARDAERYCKTLEVLIKSSRVVESALRSSAIREYSIYPKDESTAVQWLQEQLEVSMVDGSEILMISFPHKSAPRKEMRGIVDAVSKAFLDEVFFEERLRDKKSRDILEKSCQDLREEIRRKEQQLQAMLEDQPCVLLPWVAAEVELMKQQIGRLQVEIISAERRLWEQRIAAMLTERSEEAKVKVLGVIEANYAKIKEVLQQQIDELTEAVKLRSRVSPDCRAREDELASLKEIQREIVKRIECFDVELNRPEVLRAASAVVFVDP